jgi:hypothetical protein
VRRWEDSRLSALVLVAAVFAAAPEARAQSITDARRAEFTPSSDHDAVDPVSGLPLLERYVLEVFLPGGTTPVATANLGKPGPEPDGFIRIDFFALLTAPLTPGVVYEAVVSAVGPTGSASSNRSNTFAFSLPCAPGISPASQSVAAAGGGGSSTVTVAAGCAWTATSEAAWITITSGSPGSGPGAVTFAVAANDNVAPRTGTLTIAGSSFTVNQSGASCAYALDSASATLTAAGGSGSVTVTTTPECSWTAASGASWVTISSASPVTGTGTVSFSAEANTGVTPRTATLTIAGQTFVVSEPRAPCTFSASPILITAPAAGTIGTITLTTQSGCSWTSAATASWITVDGSGAESGTVAYSVPAYKGTSARSATITIAGLSIGVEQAAATLTPPTNLRIVK